MSGGLEAGVLGWVIGRLVAATVVVVGGMVWFDCYPSFGSVVVLVIAAAAVAAAYPPPVPPVSILDSHLDNTRARLRSCLPVHSPRPTLGVRLVCSSRTPFAIDRPCLRYRRNV